MEIIGEKLKTSREESGLSLEEVADDLKVTVDNVKSLEEGNQKAFEDIFMLKKLIYDYAKYLGLDYDDLIEEFNEFMFAYTSRIPVAAIEKISKEKEKEEDSKPALSPYTIKRRKHNKKIIIMAAAAVVILIALITTLLIVNSNKVNDNNSTLAALI